MSVTPPPGKCTHQAELHTLLPASLLMQHFPKGLINWNALYKYEAPGCSSECRSHEVPTFFSVSPGHSITRGDLRHLTLAATILNLATGRSNISHCYFFPALPGPADLHGLEPQESHPCIDSFLHGSIHPTKHVPALCWTQRLTVRETWSLPGAQCPEYRSLLLEGLEPPRPIGHGPFPRAHQPH